MPIAPPDARVGDSWVNNDGVHVLSDVGWVLVPSPIDLMQPPVAWHYTDVHGLLGIVSSHRLWATSPSGLNDLSELSYAFRQTEEKWAEYKTEFDPPPAVAEFINSALGAMQAPELSRNVYILSACRQGDLLNQWQHYAGRGGYAIALSTSSRFEATLQDKPGTQSSLVQQVPASWVSVLYEESAQTQALYAVFDRLASLAQAVDETDQASMPKLAALTLFWLQCRMKHPAFAAESELRYVASAPASKLYETYRVVNERPVPYVVLAARPNWVLPPDEPSRLPILAVRLGRSAPSTEDEILDLLAQYGYDGIPPSRSEVPLR